MQRAGQAWVGQVARGQAYADDGANASGEALALAWGAGLVDAVLEIGCADLAAAQRLYGGQDVLAAQVFLR